MDDLIAFVTARLDEDEAAAMAATGTAWAWEATGDKDNSWAVGYVEGEEGRPLSGEIEHGQGIVIDGVCESINGRLADAAHIARHDPARVLREVAALRRIAGMHQRPDQAEVDNYTYPEAAKFCRFCGPGDSWEAREHPDWFEAWPCTHARLIAAIWSDRPDYRPEWAA